MGGAGASDLTISRHLVQRHPIWEIEGIPEPTQEDREWWHKQKKSKRALFKAFHKYCMSGDVWRIATILEERDGMPKEQRFDLEKGTFHFANVFIMILNNAERKPSSRSKILQMLDMFLDIGKLPEQLSCSRVYFVIVDHDGDYDSAVLLSEKKFWFENYNHRLAKELIKNDKYVHLERWVEINKNTSDIDDLLSFAVQKDNLSAVKLLLPHCKDLNNEDVFYIAANAKKPDIFEILCHEKHARDVKRGLTLPIALADEWIEKNITGARKIKKEKQSPVKAKDSDWQKYEETSIWHNLPAEGNGQRLRDLFDFAARKVERYQQIADGTLHFQHRCDFDDFGNDDKIDQASQKLIKAKGDIKGYAAPTRLVGKDSL